MSDVSMILARERQQKRIKHVARYVYTHKRHSNFHYVGSYIKRWLGMLTHTQGIATSVGIKLYIVRSLLTELPTLDNHPHFKDSQV